MKAFQTRIKNYNQCSKTKTMALLTVAATSLPSEASEGTRWNTCTQKYRERWGNGRKKKTFPSIPAPRLLILEPADGDTVLEALAQVLLQPSLAPTVPEQVQVADTLAPSSVKKSWFIHTEFLSKANPHEA